MIQSSETGLRTFLSDGRADVQIRGFVFDVLRQGENIVELVVTLLQVILSHLPAQRTTHIQADKITTPLDDSPRLKHISEADLETSHGGPDLLDVPHSDNIRFKHLCDQDQPV